MVEIFGIVYLIDTAPQFWSELEDILHVPNDITLAHMDATLRTFIAFCAAYHEQYLQSPLQLEHSCDLLLTSELFTFHSERMCELLSEDAHTNTDPHCQLIIYTILLEFGRRHASFLRSHKRWVPLLPILMDHVRLNVDDLFSATTTYPSTSSGRGGVGVGIPIEAKLSALAVNLLYEVCRVQRFSLHDLRIFDDLFIEHLFDLVEQTRDQTDETFNYSVIKLLVALNEQFMVASLQPPSPQPLDAHQDQDVEKRKPEGENRVLRVLMARMTTCMTFGENLIFMLNRANRTPEDLCMQLLVLKLLYLLFTTKSTCEFFYTNDLCVLVDVFLREILNLDEENESLRHTYLRVLHPLLTKTQLRTRPYKRTQIVHVLKSLVAHETIRDIDPTTRRLVDRCLSGDWCVQLQDVQRTNSPGLDSVSSAPSSANYLVSPETPTSVKKVPKTSRSVDNFKPGPTHRLPHEVHRHNSNEGMTSFSHVASTMASLTINPGAKRHKAGSETDLSVTSNPRRNHVIDDKRLHTTEPEPLDTSLPAIQSMPHIRVVSPSSPLLTSGQLSPTPSLSASSMYSVAYGASASAKATTMSQRRMAPPPPKRRKPPAVPGRTNSGATITTIASSTSPLAAGARKVH